MDRREPAPESELLAAVEKLSRELAARRAAPRRSSTTLLAGKIGQRILPLRTPSP